MTHGSSVTDGLSESSDDRMMTTYAPAPVTFVRGEGVHLYDAAGRQYLDLLCGIAVTTLGHAHPAVTDTISRQAATLMHVSNLFSNDRAPELASRIDDLVVGAVERALPPGTPPRHGRVFFANSGAEANECAFKLARKWAGPGRHGVVSLEGGFHGRTLATLAATGQPDKQSPFLPMPDGFTVVPAGDVVALEAAVDPARVGAVVIEIIQGERGVVPLEDSYVRHVRSLCDERDVLLVVDEIQTGLCRTGRWFAFERCGIRPDIVTLAKALGNGAPIGACWARDDVAVAFVPGDHGSTFGGQPLAVSAALATLDVLERDDLADKAETTGRWVSEELRAIPGVAGVRGRGLLIGVQLDEHIDARTVASAALEAGLVVNAIGASTIRLAPPLIISSDDMRYGLEVLAAVLAESSEAEGTRQ